MAGLSLVAVSAVCLVPGVCENVTGSGCAGSRGGLVMCMLTVIHHNMVWKGNQRVYEFH